jgi:hypothetical protein
MQYEYTAYPTHKRRGKRIIAVCITKTVNLETEWCCDHPKQVKHADQRQV